MDPLHQRRLERTINTLAQITKITQSQKKNLIEKYQGMPDKDVIKDLAIKVHQVLGPNSPHYDYALNVIKNYNFGICPPIEEMKDDLVKMFSNHIEGNMSLEENHQIIKHTLTTFCNIFNHYKIDYYLVGAIPCFIKTNQPLFRYHDDIDILINEEDIHKLYTIFENTNYQFYDDRFPSLERCKEIKQHPLPHIIMAQNKDNEFHIGFFSFRREKNKSITTKEYSHRLENNQVIVDIKERIASPLGTSLRYDDHPINFNGVSFKTSSIEHVYNLKTYTQRPKDITDKELLELYLDHEKLKLIQEHKPQEKVYKNVKFPK